MHSLINFFSIKEDCREISSSTDEFYVASRILSIFISSIQAVFFSRDGNSLVE